VVALHGYRHRLQLRMSGATLREDFARGAAAIHDAVGTAPVWHRPPYGVYSPAGLRAARAAGLRSLLWSRWGKDWRRFATPGSIASRATQEISKGDIILLHDADFYSAHGSHTKTVEALPLVIAELKRRELDTVLPG
jgi:peptidoglycan/xylan/chitin deacetylase (PgdA/CDA1 family)